MSNDKVKEIEKTKRVHQIAKELNVASGEILDYLREREYHIKGMNINTKVDEEMYNEIMIKFHPEKIIADKKYEYKLKKLKIEEKEEPVQKKILKISIVYKELKPKDKKIEVKFIDETFEELEIIEKQKVEKKIEEKKEEKVEVIEAAEKIEPVKGKEVEVVEKKKVVKEEKQIPAEEEIVIEEKIEQEPKSFQEVIAERYERVERKIKKPFRRLSKEGKKITEKTKEKKERFVGDEHYDVTEIRRIRKVRKKKIDQKEIDASIKETFARMDAGKIRKKYKKTREQEEVGVEEKHVIKVSEFISVSELSELMKVEPSEVIKKCIEMGLLVTINQRLDYETISMVADEFGYEVELLPEYGLDILETEEEKEGELQERPPIVTIMGHVDHGKTSLLDFIRKSNIVAGEIGSITQHIGAYEVLYLDKRITFLDTPGHEAFTAMRARGAQVTDIVILVIAGDENVMPQTVEAIDHAKSAQVPIIIAINKIDKPNADPERIKKQLADRGMLVESWGGKYPSVEISAKTGQGVDSLLEIIIIQAELLELKANYLKPARGVIIESELDKGRGPVATVLVNNGTLEVGGSFIAGQYWGKVRALLNERGKNVLMAPPSTPVQVLGFTGLPQAGDTFTVLESERETKEIGLKRQQLKREQEYRKIRHLTLDQISQQIKFGAIKELSLIIKADVDGSMEALSDSLLKLNSENQKVAIKIVHKGVGEISESDVLLASASNSIVIGFYVRPSQKSREIARKENVDIRVYNIIYDAIEDIKKALEGMLEPEIKEEVMGTAVARETFRIPKVGTIAGLYIEEGKISRNDKIRIIRDGKEIYKGKIHSLKRFKDDAKEVSTGFECGIGVENYNDIKIGDIFEAYKIVEIKKSI